MEENRPCSTHILVPVRIHNAHDMEDAAIVWLFTEMKREISRTALRLQEL